MGGEFIPAYRPQKAGVNMKHFTRRHGSQRASASQKVSTLETSARPDGSTYDPILWLRVGDIWHAIEFENEGEARVLLSEAQHIYRSF